MKSGKDKENNKKTALEAGAAYLASRMRTTAEMRKHLESKGYDDEEIGDALSELTELRYLDDYAYALRYYEYNKEKKRGVLRAERALIEKGVDRDTVRFAKEDFLFEYGDYEFDYALAIARREAFGSDEITQNFAGGDGEDRARAEIDDRLAARIMRKLDSGGYSAGDIFRVLEVLRSEASGS